MPEKFKTRSITLPDDLVFKSQNVYNKQFPRSYEKDNFSEVVRHALTLYLDTYDKE